MDNKTKALISAAALTGTSFAAYRYAMPWIKYDIETIRRANIGMKQAEKDMINKRYLIDQFEENVVRHPDKVFLIFEGREFSYGLVDHMANKVANVAAAMGIHQGDTVAVMMANEPAFVWTFLGLQKIGVASSFINHHLKAEPLLHSLKACNPKAIIVGSGNELLQSVEDIKDQLPDEISVFVAGKTQKELGNFFTSFDDVIMSTDGTPVSRSARAGVTPQSPLCFLYTSGTTGLPKAAINNQARAIGQCTGMMALGHRHDDIMYAVTPLYHGTAMVVGLFNTIGRGATMVISPKFSASKYWDDVRKYNVTCLLYIGELFRYLLKQPENTNDGKHKLRFAAGNGLRKDIWQKFKERFRIPEIYDFFGASEGTAGMWNLCQKPGAIGRLSPLMRLLMKRREGVGIDIVKFDPLTMNLIRGKDGRCIRVGPGEEGIVISGIPATRRNIYLGRKEDDEKKIIYGAFSDGDRYFNFGDVVYLDFDYFIYFRDRTGDTFRWKGENVSTIEVANIMSGLPFIKDINVYGVDIPGTDGRAGMAAIVLNKDHTITDSILRDTFVYCRRHLPQYACPVFLRFVSQLELTQTMKHRKVELVREGFDVSQIDDPVFVVDVPNHTYKALTTLNYSNVISSRL